MKGGGDGAGGGDGVDGRWTPPEVSQVEQRLIDEVLSATLKFAFDNLQPLIKTERMGLVLLVLPLAPEGAVPESGAEIPVRVAANIPREGIELMLSQTWAMVNAHLERDRASAGGGPGW